MAVYMVFNEQVTDQAKFDTYRQQAGPLISRYGGRFLVVEATSPHWRATQDCIEL
jgi:uncharacterized protein (DUF1330 family)